MAFEFRPTCSWQAFTLVGLPSRMQQWEGKGLSLAKAVEVWNLSIKNRSSALMVGVVSTQIRKILDEARDARKAAAATRPIPQVNF